MKEDNKCFSYNLLKRWNEKHEEGISNEADETRISRIHS
jgi:hypothetical protein